MKKNTKRAYEVVNNLRKLHQIINMLPESDAMSDKDLETLRKETIKGLYEFKHSKDLMVKYFNANKEDTVRDSLMHISTMTQIPPTEMCVDILCPGEREEKIINEILYIFSHSDFIKVDSFPVLRYDGEKDFYFETNYLDDNIIQIISYYYTNQDTEETICWKKYSMHIEYNPESLNKRIVKFWIGDSVHPIL